ncbi:hypothetical protein MACJ_003577 [Theileria orientalis]|uniref:Uncharacterized protein n=1 Tax=Theileria orientalis TaxID=68886 RepID=A0A976SLC2_THEOR|nr:hypothetical protein MACJ_003577 [Theileria orientalis]
MRISQILRQNASKIDFSKSVLSKELDTLVSNYEKSLANPSLFPTHIQKLHNIASQVRSEREYLGINQSELDINKLSLQRAERVVYAIYDNLSPELYFVASREPAVHDFYKLYLHALKDSTTGTRNTSFNKWLYKHSFDTLGIYLLESINTPKISFKKIARARLLFWRSYQFISLK